MLFSGVNLQCHKSCMSKELLCNALYLHILLRMSLDKALSSIEVSF